VDVDGLPVITALFQMASQVRVGAVVSRDRIASVFAEWVHPQQAWAAGRPER
jgi:hypothetical protein